MEKKNVLFVCSFGQVRSPAAVSLFGGIFLKKGLVGASSKTVSRLSKEADRIYVFEGRHLWTYKRHFREFMNKIINLDIEDIYWKSTDPKLLELLRERMKEYGEETL